MPRTKRTTPIYKDLSYSQLRSYCEAVRLGNMSAAAESLDLSNPTVWKQIRALEHIVGVTLLESDGRRSEVTEAGQLLASLATPVVKEFEGLLNRFQELCDLTPKHLSVATPPRSFTDDLMPVICEFRQTHPDIHVTYRESFEHHGDAMLQSGEVDLVIGDSRCCLNPQKFLVEVLFEIEAMVIMPVGHPLAKRRRINPSDLAKYPVLNHPDGYPDEESNAILKRAGVFDHPDRRFNLLLASSIRSCVKQGEGIGLVGSIGGVPSSDPEIVQRTLKHCLKPNITYAYSSPRMSENPSQRLLIDLIKARLSN
ncbi:LysR family transcriptional regulator [Symmachiella dynata]|uniref:HTH-type transcriptional regulator CysB n=1 Tax=Symmachiella dynata TaxID=2527995 RepID=A0A517ZKK4_9PLAN|nr:LysR family transcriptional regulator [Symmachiella dynata]QDT47407.1 HTH-type transcriptional regulator CysB [Symmachiella dynata]QDU42985.1 HTH-type transcriptional regulator CysB [Symmachiella dynata]